ncbi:hypothetical protein EDC04DRAFT_2723922 [Pisolithus marmoratus]|nr:hypothetical protein EDC04DRAFT_2723922 [Pisolithus marmoratus]
MQNAAEGGSSNDPSEMTVALAASSMVNPADLVSTEAYQANLRRIEEMKEIVHRLEANNDQAHRNFLMDQLERRAKDGREAEEMLQRLRSTGQLSLALNPSGLPGADHQANVLLPSTATLVEVPDHSPTNPTSSSYAQPMTYHRAPQVYQSFQQSQPPPQQSSTSSTAQAQYSVPYPAPYPYYASYLYALSQPDQRPTVQQEQLKFRLDHRSSNYRTDRSGHYPHANALNQQNPGGQYGTQRPGHSRNAQRTGTTGSTGVIPTHYPVASFSAQPIPQPQPTNAQPQPILYSQHSRPAQRIPTWAPTDSAQHQAYVPQVQDQTSVTALPPPTVPSLAQPQAAYPAQPSVIQHSHYEPQVTAQSSSSASEALPQQDVQQPIVHHHDPQQHIVPPASSDHPTTQQQPQHSTGSRPQVRDQREMFIRAFQQAVQSGPEQTAILVTKVLRAGIDTLWLEAALRSVPEQQWKAIAPKFMQHIPPDLLPRQSTSPSVARPSTTALSPPIPESSTMDTAGSAPPAIGVQVDGSTPQVPTFQPGTASHIISPTEPAPISPYAYSEHATLALPASRVLSPPAAARVSTADLPITPERPMEWRKPTVRTPQQADKKRLAFDILRSLGRPVPTIDPKSVAKNKEASQRPTLSPRPVEGPAAELPSTLRSNNQENGKATEQAPSHAVPPAEHTTESSGHRMVVLPTSPPATTTLATPATQPVLQHTISPPSSIRQLPSQVEVSLSAGEPALLEDPKSQALNSTPTVIDLTLVEMEPTPTGSHQIPPEVPSPTTSKPQLNTEHPRSYRIEPLANAQAEDIRMASPSHPQIEHTALPDIETVEVPPVTGPSTPEKARSPSPTEDQSLVLGGLPLFLPSPPTSLAADRSSAPPPPDTDDDAFALDDAGIPHPSRKRYSAEREDGEAIDEDTSVVRVKKKRKERPYVLVPRPPPYVVKSKEELRRKERVARADEGTEDARSGIRYSRPEAVQSTEQSCQWRDCDAVLNCGVNLFAHLDKHGQDDPQHMPFRCRWEGCGKKFRTNDDRFQHFKIHAIFPIPCPYAAALNHKDREHRGQQLPTRPPYAAVLGRLPSRLPSHRVVPRRVYKARISPERHAVVGPWVLWNIFGPVQLNTKKQNVSIRARIAADKDGEKADANRDEYDFLLPLSAGSSRKVTQMISRGLILWGGAQSLHGAVAMSGDDSISWGEVSGPPAPVDGPKVEARVLVSVESGGKADAVDNRAPATDAAEVESVEKTLTSDKDLAKRAASLSF